MSKPKLLDLFCGAGGAGMGYIQAGFEVTGIDIAEQPDYPGHFRKGDALEYLAAHGHKYDAVHASPPCQSYSALTKGTNQGREYPALIPQTRTMLASLELPSVIENVEGSELRRDLTLCGEMFGLAVIRHRYFELNGFIAERPEHIPHRGKTKGWRHGVLSEGYYFPVHGKGGGKGSVEEWREAMGTPWIRKRRSIAQAIPPAYTRYIGTALIGALHMEVAA